MHNSKIAITKENKYDALEFIRGSFNDDFNEDTEIESKLDISEVINSYLRILSYKAFNDLNTDKFELALVLENGKPSLKRITIIETTRDILNILVNSDIKDIDANDFEYLHNVNGKDELCYIEKIDFEEII